MTDRTDRRIISERRPLEVLGPLAHGSHDEGSTACIMEAVAYVAGEPWTDTPECASPVIAAWLREWNDALPTDAERDRLLRPLIGDLIGTTADDETERRRAEMALAWLVTECAPAWLRLAGLDAHASALATWTPDQGTAVLAAARDAARAAAWAAAWDAAWDAARDAAGAAAGAAARDAARDAAWDAAWDAARAAARDAAGAAARDAAGAAAVDAARDAAGAAAGAAAVDAASAAPAATVASLQESALACVRRMIAA